MSLVSLVIMIGVEDVDVDTKVSDALLVVAEVAIEVVAVVVNGDNLEVGVVVGRGGLIETINWLVVVCDMIAIS